MKLNHKPISKFTQAIINLKSKFDLMSIIPVTIMPPLIYMLVQFTGGIKYSYSHLMYIPIILAGISLGTKMGIIIGIYGGILLGPLMTIDGENPQDFANWFLRLIIFVIVGAICGYTANALKKSIKTISTLYSHNPDTLIPNVNYLNDLKRVESDANEFILMTIIINNSEQIGDLIGVDIYNQILKKIYMYLKRDLPQETIIIQRNNNKLWLAKPYSELYSDIYKVLDILKQPLNIDEVPFYIEFSIGVNIVSRDDAINPHVYKKTDIAARQAQKHNLEYVIFHTINPNFFNGFELLGVFIEALSSNQTMLAYQPKIDVKTKKLIGLEALIRWQHPTRGLIMPNDFIPMIAETQLIHQLTTWVLKKAIMKIKEFKYENIEIHISINVSVKNLLNREFYNQVKKIFEMEKISPKQIELEITESELMVNPDEAIMMLHRFREDGFIISLDDFGKGHSSLAYLNQLPINIVKIDQCFTKSLTHEIVNRFIVSSTIDLAHKLRCKTLAEGIEDEETFKIIQKLNCDYAQGYLFARPIKDEEIIPWVKAKLQEE